MFWQLSTVGRPRGLVRGILNALDMSDSLAASDLNLQEVLAIKAAAKRRLQETYCLAVGEQYNLLVFIGRVTHQKGCDIIAEVRRLPVFTNTCPSPSIPPNPPSLSWHCQRCAG